MGEELIKGGNPMKNDLPPTDPKKVIEVLKMLEKSNPELAELLKRHVSKETGLPISTKKGVSPPVKKAWVSRIEKTLPPGDR